VSVVIGLKLPHAAEGVQVQFTPAASLVVAEKVAVALTGSVEGTPESETVITGLMVTVAVANAVVSVTDVAVMVTVLPVGTAAGAV
jgi:hypothetical protein